MKNVLIWGLDHEITRRAVQQLERENLISIKEWFQEPKTIKMNGNGSGNAPTRNWLDLVLKGIPKQDLLQCDSRIYDEMYKHLYVFMDSISRAAFFQNKRIHEYLNVFNLFIYYFYGLIKKHDINIMIFEDVPHGPANYVLYCLAKIMNIPTLIVAQSLFPNKFFYFYDIDDFGIFKQIPAYRPSIQPVILSKKYEKEWFYMKKPSWKEKLYKKTKIIHSFSEWKQERKDVLSITLDKYDGVKDCLEQTVSRKIIKCNLITAYKKQSAKIFADNVDLNIPYIYFPLHLQPEMTTSALGGIYCDQLLAIERLSQRIPDNWYIYVKENPKQDYLMRGRYFFERLRLIPKVKAIKSDFNTYDLLGNSKFVATITGTAGWEAISGGKNALVFGKAWYRCLPGVFEYHNDFDLNQILYYKINHDELERAVDELLSKTATGLINADYLPTLPQFNVQENTIQVVDFFKFILDQMLNKKDV